MSERDYLIREELQEYERIPDNKIKHNKNFEPLKYISIQERVNSDPEFEKEYISKLINEGWVQLENIKSILAEELKGKHFKYRLNGKGMSGVEKGTFRSGGIIIGTKNDDKNYIIYKAYNGCIFPLQLSDIKEIYIKDSKNEIVKLCRPQKITNFPVYLQDPSTKQAVVIYYGDNESQRQRFMGSVNYNKILKGSRWVFKDCKPLDQRQRRIKTAVFKRPMNITKYPVYLINPMTNKKTVVYYAKDNNQRDRFITSSKFQHAYNNGWSFE